MKTYSGVESTSALGDVCGQLHDSAALPTGKEPPVPIRQEACWASELVWTRWRREKCPYLCRESNSERPACSL